ncbi:hypothetical protein ASB57_11645 [Bordetella sp. N]|nr:hypothetical protein ASB57_11645 [Bordetella sp. N]
MGFAAVRGFKLALLALSCGSVVALTSGCSSVGAASGAVAAVATGAFTANPAIGLGVGITVQAATDEAVNRYMKGLHADQQILIATTAGGLPVDGTGTWSVKHMLPIENGHGKVRVIRAFDSALASCKEFMFSVQDGDTPEAPEQWFTATACEDKGLTPNTAQALAKPTWKWATAEPAVQRWGALQ